MKFLVLGNDPSLKLVNWDAVSDSTLTVVGINRSHLLYKGHDVLYLQDPKPLLELLDSGASCEDIKKLNIISTPYLLKRITRERSTRKLGDKINKKDYKKLLKILKDGCVGINKAKTRIKHFCPFTVINAISQCMEKYSEQIKESGICKFYLAGCGLKHRPDINHFWHDKAYHVRFPDNSPGGSSKRQLSRQMLVFKKLRSVFSVHGVDVVSCTDGSLLNSLYPYEDLRDVLNVNRKFNPEIQ